MIYFHFRDAAYLRDVVSKVQIIERYANFRVVFFVYMGSPTFTPTSTNPYILVHFIFEIRFFRFERVCFPHDFPIFLIFAVNLKEIERLKQGEYEKENDQHAPGIGDAGSNSWTDDILHK